MYLTYGVRRDLNFKELQSAALVCFCEADTDENRPSVTCVLEDGCVTADYANLSVLCGALPRPKGALQETIHLYRDGAEYKPAY